MKPIQEILNKIKWDDREDPSYYTIGYEDRALKKIIEIKFSEIKRIEEGFMAVDRGEEEAMIPLHRIRIVKKKGDVIWERG